MRTIFFIVDLLVIIATVAVLYSFYVAGKEEGQKSTKKGVKK